MNYFEISVNVIGVTVTGMDKKGKSYTYYDNDIFNSTFVPRTLFGFVISEIMPENEVDIFIENRTNWLNNNEYEFLKCKTKIGGKIKIPRKWKIKTVTNVSLDISVKRKNMNEYPVETCLKKMTVEQFADCFGNVLQLKID